MWFEGLARTSQTTPENSRPGVKAPLGVAEYRPWHAHTSAKFSPTKRTDTLAQSGARSQAGTGTRWRRDMSPALSRIHLTRVLPHAAALGGGRARCDAILRASTHAATMSAADAAASLTRLMLQLLQLLSLFSPSFCTRLALSPPPKAAPSRTQHATSILKVGLDPKTATTIQNHSVY